MKNYFALLFALFLLYGCGGSNEKKQELIPYELHGEAQGTTFTVKYLSKDSLDLSREVMDILVNIDQELSLWVDSSELCKFNRQSLSTRYIDSSSIYFPSVFKLSKEVFQRTNGAFNPAVMPLVKYWGFARKSEHPEQIDSLKIDSLMQHISFNMVQLVGAGFVYAVADFDLQLDFNAVAQGYSVDVIAELLTKNNIEHYMVEIGGEVVAKGKNAQGEWWTIGIDKPKDNNTDRELQAVVQLENRALATSGNYRKFYEKDGIKYSHTIDPSTGYPVQHTLLSASVFASDCGTADAYATAFMVMGVEKTKEFLKENPDLKLDVYLIFSDEKGEFKTWISEGIKGKIDEEN